MSDWFHDPFVQEELNDKNTPVKCDLFGAFGVSLQVLLAVLCFSSLVLKRHFEYPKRSSRIFMCDISKQGISAGWMHVMNIILAVYLELKVNKGNGCQWYFINIICENMFGVAITLMIHQTVIHFANKYDILILQSGVYLSIHDAQYVYRYSYEDLDKHINYRVWMIQLVIWLMITTIAKLLVFGLEYQNAEDLINFGISTLNPLEQYPKIELFIVMMLIPFIMNTLQYWIQDNFLKGTDFIEEQKRQKSENSKEMRQLYVLQDGMIDFQKNREQYRIEKGLRQQDPNSSDLDDVLHEKEVEDGAYVFVDEDKQRRRLSEGKYNQDGTIRKSHVMRVIDQQNPEVIRKSHIVRQIDEGSIGIRDQDYDENGQLNLARVEKRLLANQKKQ